MGSLNTGTDISAPPQDPIQYTMMCSMLVCPEQPHLSAVARTGLKYPPEKLNAKILETTFELPSRLNG